MKDLPIAAIRVESLDPDGNVITTMSIDLADHDSFRVQESIKDFTMLQLLRFHRQATTHHNLNGDQNEQNRNHLPASRRNPPRHHA